MAPNVNEVSLISDALAELELALHQNKGFAVSSPYPPLHLASEASETYWFWPHEEDRHQTTEHQTKVFSLASLEERLLNDAAERWRCNEYNTTTNTNADHDNYWQWTCSNNDNESQQSAIHA